MSPKLSNDVEQFICAAEQGVVQVQGATGATYWVLTEEAMQIRQLVTEGLLEAERGEFGEWNAKEIKEAGRRRKNEASD